MYLKICSVPFINIYRPQRSWGKVIFSEACVKNSVHRGDRPFNTTHPGRTPRADPSWADLPSACREIPATSGQYAFYWNVYLLPPAHEVWGKVIFLHLFAILFIGMLSACWDTIPPGQSTPQIRHPPDQATPHHPWTRPPRRRACWEIRSKRGRYASYRNAYLFRRNLNGD